MTANNDRVDSTVTRIEHDAKDHKGLDAFHNELNDLRQADMQGGHLDRKAYEADLKAVSAKLHKDGVLPGLDLVETKDGHAAIVGLSGDGKPDGHGELITHAAHTTYKYDNNGHVVEYTPDKGNTWKYDQTDGKYYEFDHGKKTGQSTADVISVDQHGLETVTHQDGSTTTTNRWGGTIDRNADGNITQETRHDNVRTFSYDDKGHLSGVADYASTDARDANQPKDTYSVDPATGKFFSSTDTSHQDPLEIKVLDEKGNYGTVEIKHTADNGRIEDQRLGGTVTNWNSDHSEVTSIAYRNGSTATDFSYDKDHTLTGFTMTGKDGVKHTYTEQNGQLTIDAGTADEQKVKGTLATDDIGRINVTETGDGSDKQYKTISFRLGGAEVDGNHDGVTRVLNPNGTENTFQYNDQGKLDRVQAYGQDLQLKNGQWVDANGDPADVTPTVNDHGTLTLTKKDGTFKSFTPGGVTFEGMDEPKPDASGSGSPSTSGYNAAETVGAWGGFTNGHIPESAMTDVYGLDVAPSVADNLKALLGAAQKAGVWHPGEPFATGTYRPYSEQVQLWNEHENGQHPAPVAPPGTSMHGWGEAIDFNTNNPQLISWLANNADKYGLHNLASEAWHYSVNGA